MHPSTLSEIEHRIEELSPADQLLLIERVVRRLRNRSDRKESPTDNELAEMAADPDIQREIREINEEFASTEMDGLEDD